MIVEHEVIEQIGDDPNGWLLSRVCDLIESLGKEPFLVLRGMYAEELIAFMDKDGKSLLEYRSAEILRNGERVESVWVASIYEG